MNPDIIAFLSDGIATREEQKQAALEIERLQTEVDRLKALLTLWKNKRKGRQIA